MRDFISINNHSGLGAIGFSRAAIASIAAIAVKEVQGASPYSPKATKKQNAKKGKENVNRFSEEGAVKVVFAKEGKAVIKMDVSITRGKPVTEVCSKIQENVAMAVSLMCDVVPFDVRVRVCSIAG